MKAWAHALPLMSRKTWSVAVSNWDWTGAEGLIIRELLRVGAWHLYWSRADLTHPMYAEADRA